MRKKKEKLPVQPTTQSAADWTNIKTTPPPYYKIISLKLKSGKIIDDCARIPDGKGDYYVGALGIEINDVSHWRDFVWHYPYSERKYDKKH